jgi:CubicO group peptidase (beta-lactamase class C family)
MMRVLKIVGAGLAAAAIWVGVVMVGELEGWWRTPLAPEGDRGAFVAAVTARLDASPGNAAFVLIEKGKPVAAHHMSRGKPVNADTLFQVASLSKWITAWGVMTLVERGLVDLDAPVSRYLSRWSLPPSEYNNNAVTVRRILSHTAGFTDGLGYAGFKPGEPMQSLEDSLTRAADASPGASGITRVGRAPGSGFQYSGGGYTLLQLLIEEVSGRPFNQYMTEEVLRPLGMARSTFVLDDTSSTNVAEFFDVDGKQAPHFRFTATAAASLYTSAADLTRFIQAHLPGANGEPEGRGILRPETLRAMREPHASQWGADIWGLGVILYAPNNAGGYVAGHDGGNAPAVNTTARFDPATGDGIIVLETGGKALASTLGSEWVFWKTGNVDLVWLMLRLRPFLLTAGIGGAVAFLIGGTLGWFVTRRRGPAHPRLS